MRPQDREGDSNSVGRGYNHQSSSRSRGGRSGDRSLDIHDHDDQRDMSGEARRRRSGDEYHHHHSSSRYRSYDDEPRASGNRYQASSSSHSRGRSRDRSLDFDGQRNMSSGETMRRSSGYHHRPNNSSYYEPQRSQSCGPHYCYPSSSRDDYYHQERNYSSHQSRKRWRSPDSSNQNVQQNDEGVNRSRRQKGIGEGRQQDSSYERRPFGSINGAEMQMQRAAPHPMTSNGSQRTDNAAKTLSLGRNGVNNMSSYHRYHQPMDASHQRRPLASSRRDSSCQPPNGQVRMRAPQFNKINDIPTLIQAAYSSLSALSLSPSNTAAFWNSLAKQLGRNNHLNLTHEKMGSHINQLFQHTQRTLGSFGMKDLAQTTYSMAKLADLLHKRRSSNSRRKDNIASSLSNLLLNDDGRVSEDLFLSLAKASVRNLSQFNPQGLSNLAYAYALIEYVPKFDDGSDLFDHIAMQSIKMRAEFNAQDVSNMVWAFATVKKRHDALFKAMGDQVVAQDRLRDSQPLSNTVWAYATAGVSHPDLFEKVASHIVRLGHLRDFEPQALSNIVWAYAKAGVSHPKLFEKVGNHVAGLRSLDRFTHPQDVSNTVWAYATAGVNHPQLFEKMANHIIGLDNLRRLDPQAISNTVWAFVTAEVNHPKLFEKVANHIVEVGHLKDFNTQNLSNIVWAYAAAQVSHPKMFQQVAKAAIQRNEEFISQHVANLLWSYATLGIDDKQLFSAFVPTAVKLIDNFNTQDLGNIAWAYAVADVEAPTLFNDSFIDKCLEKKDGFSIEHISQLHQWHLWNTKEKSRTGLPEALQDRCYKVFISRAPRPSKFQDDVVGQLSTIGLDPKEEMLLDSGYRLDALVEVNGRTIGVEVDGPFHFIGRSKSPLGSTILKRRQVPAVDDIDLVSVPYWEWSKLGSEWDKPGKSQAKKQEYLRKLLNL